MSFNKSEVLLHHQCQQQKMRSVSKQAGLHIVSNKNSPCSAQNATYYQRSKFLQHPLYNCNNCQMVNNNNMSTNMTAKSLQYLFAKRYVFCLKIRDTVLISRNFQNIRLNLADFLLKFCTFYSDWKSDEVAKLKYILYIYIYYARIFTYSMSKK